MKISKILLRNFKSFKSEAIDVPDIMSFIGENNAGKSNVLKALELFFSETKTLEQHFFNDDKQKMVIQIWFRNLNDDAKKTFRKVFLPYNNCLAVIQRSE